MPSDLLTTTLAAGPTGSLAVDLLKILACAGLVAVLFGALRVSAIPGYLVAGAIIGPHAIGLIQSDESVQGIASLAVVLLMFGIGLHLDLSALRRGLARILLVGIASTVTTAGLSTLVAMAFGLGWPSAVAVGLAFSMSSTAVVMQVIQKRRELHRAYARLSFGVLIVQDLLVIAWMAALPGLAKFAERAAEGAAAVEEETAATGSLSDVLLQGIVPLSAIALMLLVGKLALPPLMIRLSRFISPEVMLVVSAAVALGAAVLCGALGLSPELGAFIAGFLLAATPFRFQLSGQITPLRDLFMAVFFTAVGLQLNVGEVIASWWVVGIGIVAAMGLTTVSITGWAWCVGTPPGAAAQAGLTLGQGGEFSLVLLSAAAGLGLVTGQVETITLAVVVCSLLLTPTIMNLGRKAGIAAAIWPPAPWTQAASLSDRPTAGDAVSVAEGEDPKPHAEVVIAGFGPVGRACAEEMERRGIGFSIIELNTHTVKRQRALGRSIVYGDVTNPEVLESAGVAEADAVIVTIPDDDAMLRACRQIRLLNPNVFISARAGVLSRAMQAKELGADHVTVEELAAAQAMSRETAKRLEDRRGYRGDPGPTQVASVREASSSGTPG